MAQSTKKYFLYTIFLFSPISLSLYAQSTVTSEAIVSVEAQCNLTSFKATNQKNDPATGISQLENSNQFIAGLSTPKDSLTIAAEMKDLSADCNENSLISATSILAKDIIENYKYDFSETFIDILFFERIDLSRTRTI